MKLSNRYPSSVLLACLVVALAGCAEKDPRTQVLEERARWEVQALGWAVSDEDSSVRLSTRVIGPPNAKIKRLTIRIDLLDAGDQPLVRHWHSFDLSQIPRGGPKDIVVSVPTEGQAVENVALNMLFAPDAEDESKMAELQGLDS